MVERVKIVSPGLFSLQVPADSCRLAFDYMNEVIVNNAIPVDFVFIGDSITQFWELGAYFSKNDRMVLNRGIGGDTTEYLLKRLEADVLQLKPKYAVLKIGVNDTMKLESDPWQKIRGKEPDEIKKTILDNMNSIITIAKEKGLHLIICSILPTNMVVTQKNKERNVLINEVNPEIRAMTEKAGFVYVDYHSGFVGKDGMTLMDGLSDDGVHPHVIGYNRMAGILRETLEKHGIEI
jgi:Lysophospholipase L1 and related esterases